MVLGTFAACGSAEKETDEPKEEQSEVDESETEKESDEKESNTEDGGNTEDSGNTEDGGNENEEPEEEPLVKSTAGLEFELNADGKSYTLVGIGTCTATEIVIDGYNGLPVTSIGDDAFYDCDSLTSITVDANNSTYKSIDGNLYSKDGKRLIQYAIGKTDISFATPDSVTSIGDWVFYDCDSLTSVTIGNSVTSIGSSAF